MIPCSRLFGGWEVSCQQEFDIQRLAIYPIIMMKYGSVKFYVRQDGAGVLIYPNITQGGQNLFDIIEPLCTISMSPDSSIKFP